MMKNNKKGNQQNNYFTKNIRDRGEDFLFYKTAKDLEFDAMSVFRDIARGKVDLNKFGGYFLNTQFLDSLIKVSYEKYCTHQISYNGVSMLINSYASMGQSPDMMVLTVNENHKRLAEAYLIIYNTLMYIKNTNDVTNLYILPNNLNIYKNML
ncbi:MAG: hypothetical protein ACRCXT_11400 [Paraclostridium sp.]